MGALRLVFAVASLWLAMLGTSQAALQLARIADLASDGSGYPGGLPLPPRTLVLTIDDGPLGLNPELAEFLHARGVRATFFLVGNRVNTHSEGVQILATLEALGHQLGNHTETHARLTLDPAGAPLQVRATRRRLAPYLGNGFHPFRPPFAAWNAAVYAALATPEFESTQGPFFFEIDGSDYNCFENGITAVQCAEDYRDLTLARPQQSGVIVLHEHVEVAEPSFHRVMIETLLDLLAAEPGPPFTWVTLDAVPGVAGGLAAGPAALVGGDFADAGPLGSPESSATLRAGDLDADGDDDVCARAADGVYCALSDGVALGPATLWSGTFSDAAGFADPSYATTLQLADVGGDGRADLCLRSAAGLVCEASDGIDAFVPSPWVSAAFSDAAGFGAAEGRYRSLRLGDVDGDGRADACARDGAGVVCALAGEAGFAAATTWSTALADADGWAPPEYGATLALADLDGDARADLCARSASGIECGRSDGASFAAPAPWLANVFTDAEGWAARSRFLSLRVADVNGDAKADACGRHATGIECAVSDGTRFRDTHYAVNTDFLDVQGWGTEARGASLLVARIEGAQTVGLCGRAAAGLVCHRAPRDPDRDGVDESLDTCPAKWNPGQLDSDGDGMGDACEPGALGCGLGAELALLLALLRRAQRAAGRARSTR